MAGGGAVARLEPADPDRWPALLEEMVPRPLVRLALAGAGCSTSLVPLARSTDIRQGRRGLPITVICNR